MPSGDWQNSAMWKTSQILAHSPIKPPAVCRHADKNTTYWFCEKRRELLAVMRRQAIFSSRFTGSSMRTARKSGHPAGNLLIRTMVGVVFLSEGIQKLLFAEKLGAGRFEVIGLPVPEVLGPLVGTTEIICGVLVLAGFLTRLAAIPLVLVMLTAIITTKLPLLQDGGFWKMMHESRTDWAMLLGSLFLILEGPGRWSLDQKITRSRIPVRD
jgi:putative oxidoreductase